MRGYIGALHEYDNAAMPLATAVPAGTVVYNTTYSVEMRSNGARWVPLGPFRIYAHGGDVVVTNTTADTEVATFTIPAKMMGTGVLMFFADWTHTNSANSKQFKVFFGGSLLISPVGFTSSLSVAGMYHIRNVTASSQIGTGAVATGSGSSTGSLATGSVNTDTGDVVVSIQFKMSALGETMTLKNLYVELHP